MRSLIVRRSTVMLFMLCLRLGAEGFKFGVDDYVNKQLSTSMRRWALQHVHEASEYFKIGRCSTSTGD